MLVGLTRPSGGFEAHEKFRLAALIFSSLGAMFFGLLPFVLADSGWTTDTMWMILGGLFVVYCGVAGFILPRGSIRLRRTYPELFPRRLILLQSSLHASAVLMGILVMLRLTGYESALYSMALILLLAHGAIAFVRTLFYRR